MKIFYVPLRYINSFVSWIFHCWNCKLEYNNFDIIRKGFILFGIAFSFEYKKEKEKNRG